MYVVIRKDAKGDSPARVLRDYLLTKDGQALVGATGYVPVLGAKRPVADTKPAAETRPAAAGS